MNTSRFIPIALVFVLSSCVSRISTSIIRSYPALDSKTEVKVIEIQDPIPAKAEDLGYAKIRDNGGSDNCNYNWSIEAAKAEARKIGGNAIKIMKYHYFNEPLIECNDITAKILKVEDFNKFNLSKSDSILEKADYALFHIYRKFSTGFLISYEVQLGDSLLCYANADWKETVKIKRYGSDTLKAWTEAKAQLPINIKMGKEYYIRSSITMGMFVGRPKLELVAKEIGRKEFESIDYISSVNPGGKVNNQDVIYLNDDRKYVGMITSEDNDNIYFTLIKNDKKVTTTVAKRNIKKIDRRD